jgi:hypothetical protein
MAEKVKTKKADAIVCVIGDEVKSLAAISACSDRCTFLVQLEGT